MTTHGEMLDPTEEMWLGKMSMITIVGFTNLADKCRIQCDNQNRASFQVHTEVEIMKFKRNKEGLHCHQFSPEFIVSIKKQGTQPLGTVEENIIGHTEQQQDKAKEAMNHTTLLGHHLQRISNTSSKVTMSETVQ